jgi:hypothetical protein
VVATAVGCAAAAERERTERGPCAPPAVVRESWRHDVRGGAFASGVGDAHHSAKDVVVRPGQPATLHGKFAYGSMSKDLEDEWVSLWVGDGGCTAREVHRAITDDDGRVSFEVPGRSAGDYPFWMLVPGDGTSAAGRVWVVAPGTRAVLFDVDGTLTTGDGELMEDLFGGGSPEVMVDASRVARHRQQQGLLVIYVTGRPYLLHAATAAWLENRGFPRGPVMTTDRMRDAVPSTGGVGEFKQRLLGDLRSLGLDIVWAYGNASTDVCAYARAGIGPDRTWMVGGPQQCDGFAPTQGLSSYTAHLRELTSR